MASWGRRLIGAVVISGLLGMVIGIVGMAHVAKYAAQYFVVELKHRYVVDEEIRGQRSFEKRDFHQAVSHYRNLVYFTSSEQETVFEKNKQGWSLLFPISGSLANYFNQYAKLKPETLKVDEGTRRARLASALESAGLRREAQEQYELVATLMGYGSVDKAKVFAGALMKVQ